MILLIIQIAISIALIASVLVQSQSGGLGSAFGGGSSYHTRRGVEKSIFTMTIILTILYTGSSLLSLILQPL